jgi:hypothetical protein
MFLSVLLPVPDRDERNRNEAMPSCRDVDRDGIVMGESASVHTWEKNEDKPNVVARRNDGYHDA